MFESYREFHYTLAGRPLIIETGKMAGLANGSCLVRYGDTVILATATASEKPRDGVDFLPLSVDFDERQYAAGKIPGGYFRREGRPTEKAIITSRLIDRPLRPLFPKDLRNDVAINLLVLSVDLDNSPEIAAMLGASVALSISDIPWNGPIAGVFVGLVDGEYVLNPTAAQRERSRLELTVAGTKEKVIMIEAGAKEVSNEEMYNAIMFAQEENKKLCEFIANIQAEIGKPKFEYTPEEINQELYEKIKEFCIEDVKAALDTDDKNVRDEAMQALTEKVYAQFDEEYPDSHAMMDLILYYLQKAVVREWLLEGKRVDGRALDEIRPMAAEVGLLPRVHGSAMFTRGQTKVITAATLGSLA